jgi:nucleotide-binding universal stress UspA family protein
METTAATSAPSGSQALRVGERGRFGLIVVGVDATAETLEAVRQAGALADANSTIELVAVGLQNAESTLASAEAELGSSPARVITRSISAGPPWKALLAEASGADLLVVGRHTSSRLGGYLLGSTATHVLHHAQVPVLVAVAPSEGVFPDRVLAAAGPESSHPELPAATAAAIARRAGAELVLLRVDWSRARMAPALATVVDDYERETSEPIDDLIVGGGPHHEILAAAAREGASLVVLGSRELGGLALRSVSERVAHEAPCSVLVVHAGDS